MAATDKIHHGRNVKRFREMLGIKQDALAFDLGDDWNQQKISLLEQKETIDRPLLEQLATILKVPAEAIENFNEDAAVTYFNTFNDHSFTNSNGAFSPNNCTFNAYNEWKEAISELKSIQEENKKLYERLVESEREKVALLEKIINGKG